MADSIIQLGKRECFICSTTLNLERHHIMFGTRFRTKAERLGLWVYLCADHHRGKFSPHNNRNINFDLKCAAQSCYEETHSREEWMAEFGRNYLKK